MREDHGLSIEAARDIWINAIGRMLPAVPLDPEPSKFTGLRLVALRHDGSNRI